MRNNSIIVIIAVLAFFIIACGGTGKDTAANTGENMEKQVNEIAESFVKLCFYLGKHDKDYVDSYYGPEHLKKETETEEKSLDQIKQDADKLVEKLGKITVNETDKLLWKRRKNLLCLIRSLKARSEMIAGRKMTFDEESQALYDAVSPPFPMERFDGVLKELDALLPGEGTLEDRANSFMGQFTVPPDKVDDVVSAAIDESRKRTKAHIQLPGNERFEIEYVTGKPWGAYNWFKGDAHSLIQFNTDLPVPVGNVVNLACHEGYPGHHVYSTLMEQKLYKGKGWVEYSINPLFSPVAMMMEGTANFGIEVVFPKKERLAFEKDVIFPLAGLDPGKVELYHKVLELTAKLSFARNDVSRLFIDGKISREEAVERLSKYGLRDRAWAEKSLAFLEHYRTYIITYNLGMKMVGDYMEKQGATPDNPQKMWSEFEKLLSEPFLPSDLK